MKKTKMREMGEQLTVNAEQLAKLLGCGRSTAVKIGIEADAKIQIGKRVPFIVDKIEQYLEDQSR